MRRALLVLLVAAAIAATAQANFAAAPGFSGRIADCTSCHQPPLQDDTAQVAIAGLPDAWAPETAYHWIVAVTGGPASIPGGPMAGFELEVLSGTVAPGPEATGDVRTFHPKQATYTEQGVRQREWSVTWTSPDLSAYPTPITVWVAGMAANGNHNTDLNASDAGEHGDSVHNTSYVITPAPGTLEAWRGMPLQPPAIDRIVDQNGRHVIHGRLLDGNATTIQVHDGDQWVGRNVGPVWKLNVQGDGEIRLRSAGAERFSPEVGIDLGAGQVVDLGAKEPDNESPAMGIALTITFLAFVARRHP